MRRLLRFAVRLLAFLLVVALAGAAVGVVYYKRYVLDDPGEHISRAAIEATIAQESPILYRDGETRLGVLFSEEHRSYVPYDRIPKAWVEAIVASEDARFWSHPGLDPKGIVRAMVQNLQAGRVVAGGSTLTQQTAKNLFYRPDRSWQSKWEELVDALRLEAHYSKEEILEFYANQFHVNANGRGLAIAARYFFDKNVEDLTTLECAFLAGMVKGPANYNPFLGLSEERRAGARDRARVRTRAVLDRMLAVDYLDPEEHARLSAEEIPFRRGEFRYDSSVLIDEVAARLEAAPFPELFRELGLDNPYTAGIQIITTLDADAQREAVSAMGRHLTEVEALLEGTAVADLRLPSAQAPEPDPDNPPGAHAFAPAVVKGAAPGDSRGLLLDLGGSICVVDEPGLLRMATVLARARSGEPWREAKSADIDALVEALGVGSVVLASVRTEGTCDLEVRPKLQGAALLLERGQIRAMVGGSDNRNFNRAVAAKRQLGSTWKPLVLYAALQLGWAPTDLLDNRSNAFNFEGTWYYPRPDHKSSDFVSLAWAGTRSENLATIWLLAHLTDRLTPDQLRRVADLVGLRPQAGEGRVEDIKRIRDEHGILSTEGRLDDVAFYGARDEVLATGLLAHPEDAVELRTMISGRGVDAEATRVRRDEGGAERERQIGALRANFVRMTSLSERCVAAATALRAASVAGAPPPAAVLGDLSVSRADGGLRFGCGELGEGWESAALLAADAFAAGEPLPAPRDDDLLLDGRLHVSTVRDVARASARLRLVLETADPYDWDVLSHHPDFRILLNMRYIAGLARRLGVSEELPSVLSLPLGAVDISLEEAASMYQGMMDGQIWRFPGTRFSDGLVPGLRASAPVAAPDDPTQLIAEIRDRDGVVLYRASPVPQPVADPVAGRLVGDVLRNVVRFGTGRRAATAISLGGQPVPVAGKTGTTNNYRNAAFAGFIPVLRGDQWAWSEGFTLAVYVGNDDNTPMRRGGVKLQGASGALPVWIGLAQGLAERGLLGDGAPTSPEWSVEPGFVPVAVDELTGLPALGEGGEGGEGAAALVQAQDSDDEPARRFAPFALEGGPLLAAQDALPGAVEVAAEPGEDEDAAPPDAIEDDDIAVRISPTALGWPPERELPEGDGRSSGAEGEGIDGGDGDDAPPAPPEPDDDIDPRIAPPE